ncbi:MAG TPA: 2-iminoacetate synthase ThiH, partial [Chthoniobacterales bacterium]
LTVSLPRLRPAAGEFEPRYPLPDRELLQLICALRLTFPQVGIVMSTREPAPLRDVAARIGVTMMSAGSHTEPGGYTGQGAEQLHLTVRGRAVACETPAQAATEQFAISDTRTAAEVASMLTGAGLDPVWKDWDAAILGA